MKYKAKAAVYMQMNAVTLLKAKHNLLYIRNQSYRAVNTFQTQSALYKESVRTAL